MVDFTEEQEIFLKKASEGYDVLVDACIGSGKTTVIQAACGLLSRQGKTVLYLTYNRRLLEEARKRIHSMDADVHTFHSFAGSMLNRAGVPASSEREVPYMFTKRLKKIPKYDTVIVDEYQDIMEDLKDMLWHIIRMSVNNYGMAPQFLVVGDRDQKIVDNTQIDAGTEIITMMEFLGHVHKRPYQSVIFTNCFRLDAESAAKIGQAWGKSIIGTNKDCKYLLADINSCLRFLSKYEPKDILVLGNNMSWGKRVELQNMLELTWPEKFNKNTVYSSITERDGDRRGLDTSECAVFTTYDSAKGMERKVCVLCNFDQGYLKARMEHQTSRKILKNLFLVGASRGKEFNIILDDRRSQIMTIKDVGRISGKVKADMKPEFISDMFDFKFKEDVDRCLDLIKTETEQKPENIINVSMTSGQIDLSICIGIYVQAVFFENYDVDLMIDIAWDERIVSGNFPKALPPYEKTWPLWKKILFLTALMTGQERYFMQVDSSYISDESVEKLIDRLSEYMDPEIPVERSCDIIYRNCRDTDTGEDLGDKIIRGRMDAIAVDMPWELKFVNAIKVEHILQAAVYAACTDGICMLWNLKTNEMLYVTVDDTERFLREVLSCISKKKIRSSEAQVRSNVLDPCAERVIYKLGDP